MVKRRYHKHTHEVRFGICDYHLCKRRTKVEKCVHCGSWFCGEHLAPIPPTFPNFVKEYSPEYLRWQKGNGHGCPDYYDYLVRTHEKEQNEWGRTLDILHEIKPGTLFDKKTPQEELDKMCSYHLCKQKTTLYTCNRCGQKFCKTHLYPRAPSTLRVKATNKELAKEWERDGHPCPGYYKKDVIEPSGFYEKNAAKTKYSEKQGFKQAEETHEEQHESKEVNFTIREDLEDFWYWNKGKIFKGIIILIFLILIGFFVYTGLKSGEIQSFLVGIMSSLPASPHSESSYTNSISPFSSKPTIDIPALELQIHDLINSERQKNGKSALDWNSKLNVIARKYSEDMAARNYFSHYSPEGGDFSDRYSQAGFTCAITVGMYIYGGAENIFQNNLYDSVTRTNGIISSYDWNSQSEIATSTVNGWMNSQGHRDNILESFWKTEGIGVAISTDNKVYITENFC